MLYMIYTQIKLQVQDGYKHPPPQLFLTMPLIPET